MGLKFHLLSVFREIFLTHHRSLEFRAKVFAAILLAKKEILPKDYETLKKLTKEIYSDDPKRAGVLYILVKEYIDKCKLYKTLNLDKLLKDIDMQLQYVKRYAKKIDFSHLRRLISDDNEEDALIQQRVYEFFVNEVNMYL